MWWKQQKGTDRWTAAWFPWHRHLPWEHTKLAQCCRCDLNQYNCVYGRVIIQYLFFPKQKSENQILTFAKNGCFLRTFTKSKASSLLCCRTWEVSRVRTEATCGQVLTSQWHDPEFCWWRACLGKLGITWLIWIVNSLGTEKSSWHPCSRPQSWSVPNYLLFPNTRAHWTLTWYLLWGLEANQLMDLLRTTVGQWDLPLLVLSESHPKPLPSGQRRLPFEPTIPLLCVHL